MVMYERRLNTAYVGGTDRSWTWQRASTRGVVTPELSMARTFQHERSEEEEEEEEDR